jgi:hypothetical protein
MIDSKQDEGWLSTDLYLVPEYNFNECDENRNIREILKNYNDNVPMKYRGVIV